MISNITLYRDSVEAVIDFGNKVERVIAKRDECTVSYLDSDVTSLETLRLYMHGKTLLEIVGNNEDNVVNYGVNTYTTLADCYGALKDWKTAVLLPSAYGTIEPGNYGDITVDETGDNWTVNTGVIGTDNLGSDITNYGKDLLTQTNEADFKAFINLESTTDLPEGTNLYFTEQRVLDIINEQPPAIVSVNLNYTASPTNGIITNDGGNDATIPAATTTNAGLLLPEDKTRLNNLDSNLSGKEPTITAGTNSQYWRGDKTWQNFPTIPTVGTWGALNYPTWTAGTPFVKMTAAGTFALDTNTYLTSVSATGPITSSGGSTPTISTSMATNKLIGRSSSGTGVMEEISVGTGLSLSGGTLSSTISGTIPHANTSGTDTYTATITGVSSYIDGDAYLIRFTNGNTTGCSLNINSLGAKDLYRNNDGVLIGGDIISGAEMLCVYNSTLNGFQCIGTSPNTLLAYVTNAESTTITKGQPVYAFSGTGDRMSVKLASNTSDATSAQTVGLVLSSSIAANQKGIIIIQGLLDGLSTLPTGTFSDGNPIYLGATAGSITNVKPYAPNHLVYLGVVTTASPGAAGRMYVRVQNGYELDELHNVQAQSPSVNDVLYYFGGTPGQWKTASIPSVLGYTPENTTNKSDSYTVSSSTTYATTKALVDGLSTKLSTSLKGAANGLAELDSNGLVPTSQLPSYVDDVLEYTNLAAFPATGTTGKIYIALDTNLTYRWSGSTYVEISASLALGITSSTAFRGDYGNTAYNHSQIISGNPHGTTKSDIGLGNVENTALSTWAGSTNITTLGTISSGTWNGSTIDVTKGGTGATTLTGILIGNGTSAFTGVTGTASQLLRRNSANTGYEFFTPTYLTSNQTITLSGDVTGSGATSISTTIANSAVTLGKMANLAANSIIGNNTGSAATPIALTTAQTTAMLDLFSNTLKGLVPASGGGTTNFLRADGTWAAPAGGGGGTTYTFSTGLTNSSGTVTANLSTGVSGGQSVIGGTAASNNLTLSSTSNATKGAIIFGTSEYDEANNRLGIQQLTPTSKIHLNHNQNSETQNDANGILLANSTAAQSGTQSISPPLILQGNGWGTTGSASQDVRIMMDMLPIQETTAGGVFRLRSNIAGGGYSDRMRITTDGTQNCAAFLPSAISSAVGLGTTTGFYYVANINPTANSTSQYRSLSLNVRINAANINFTGNTINGIYGENRILNAGTISSDLIGLNINGALFGGDAATSGTISNAIGIRSLAFNSFSNTLAATITNAYGFNYRDSAKASLTITNQAAIAIPNLSNATNNTSLLLGTETIPSGNWGIYNSSSYNNYFNGNLGLGTTSPTSKLHIVAGTLADTVSGMYYSATMPNTITATNNAVNLQITSSGSSTQTNRGFNIEYLAGYTGSGLTVGSRVVNFAAGTGTDYLNVICNIAQITNCTSTTTGVNIGNYGIANGGTLNVGVWGRSNLTTNSATNIGVLGIGLNSGTSPVQIGGYFGLQNSNPTYTSAALMCDNGTQTSPIFVARDNGTMVWQIIDGGNTQWADAINMVFDTTTGTKIGTTTSQKIGFWNATPIVQPANTVAIDTILVNLGLRASGGTSNFSTNISTTGSVTVADSAYGASWNGDTTVPTKNAVYDKIEALVLSSGSGSNLSLDDFVADGSLTILNDNGTGVTIPLATATSPGIIGATNFSKLNDFNTFRQTPGGGTTGQVLTKASNSDYDVTWSSVPSESLAIAYAVAL